MARIANGSQARAVLPKPFSRRNVNLSHRLAPAPVTRPRRTNRSVLPALPPAPIRQEKLDAAPASAALEIPARKRAHVRALVKYGMTMQQVAELYGVPVETVERLFRKP